LKLFSLLVLIPISVLASGNGGSGETDIIPRTINFLIFAGIVYYLLADKIRDFFIGRRDDIAKKLELVQEKLKQAKHEREAAVKGVHEAKEQAKHIAETAKKEIVILVDKVKAGAVAEISNLEKSSKDRMDVEERKSMRDVVTHFSGDLFDAKNLGIENSDIANIIKKKVA